LKPLTRDVDTATLRRELETFLQDHQFWPPFQHFQARGRADLYLDIRATGGVHRWAGEMGLRVRPREIVLLRWPEECIRRELPRYLEGKTQWPPIEEFRAAGLEQMRIAISWTGGPERWASEMGIPLRRARRQTHRWSYAEMRDAISQLAGDSGRWPTWRTVEKGGLGLQHATRRPDVREQLCKDLKLSSPTRSHQRTHCWTDDQVEDALRSLLAGRNTWPGVDDFRAAGLRGLYESLRRRGLLNEWAARFG
jgi:hypothetical protein